MNRIVRSSFAIVAAALAFSAAETQAQVGFSIAGGPSFATGDFGDGLDMGYHAKVAAAFSLPMLPIGLEADAMWTRFNVSDIDDAHVQVLNGGINAVINLPTPGITPYIIGGVGYYNTKIEVADQDADSNDFGVNVGAGVRMGLVGLGGVFAEARLHNIFGEGDSVRFIPVSLGIRF
ncbi:MAG TPA: outer membrane beta-barrel protein [Longimicrobiales bacterium]|nr:outer membrane beta-barrel protein [Longimicrobiales bacterium]